MVALIAGAFEPERIILFGSSATGDGRPDSDVDLLVVMPDGTDETQATVAMHALLHHTPLPKDIVASRRRQWPTVGAAWATWLEFARRNLRIVAALRATDPTLFTAACAHAQQSAEKSLKAVLVLHDLLVPFKHDRAYLRRVVDDHLPPGPQQDDLDRLNRWGAAARHRRHRDGRARRTSRP